MELIGHVGHQISCRAVPPQIVDPLDEVCNHIIDGTTVLCRVPRVQHSLVQRRPQVVPLLVLPGNTMQTNASQQKMLKCVPHQPLKRFGSQCFSILHRERPVAKSSHVPIVSPLRHVSSTGELVIVPQDFLQQLWGVHGHRLHSVSVDGPMALLLIDLM